MYLKGCLLKRMETQPIMLANSTPEPHHGPQCPSPYQNNSSASLRVSRSPTSSPSAHKWPSRELSSYSVTLVGVLFSWHRPSSSRCQVCFPQVPGGSHSAAWGSTALASTSALCIVTAQPCHNESFHRTHPFFLWSGGGR